MQWTTDRTAAALVARHGDAGRQFLDGLGETVADHARDWGLSDLVPLAGATASAVLRARDAAGTAVVLTVPGPGDDARAGAAWLSAHRGFAPRVLASSATAYLCAYVDAAPEDGTLGDAAVEMLVPLWYELQLDPVELRAFDTAAACRTALGRISAADPARGTGLVPRLHGVADKVEEAIMATAARGALRWCHGDLHAGNVLVGVAGPTVLDPDPCAAPAALDAAHFATDPRRGTGALARLEFLDGAGVATMDDLVPFARLAAARHLGFSCWHRGADDPLTATAVAVVDELFGPDA